MEAFDDNSTKAEVIAFLKLVPSSLHFASEHVHFVHIRKSTYIRAAYLRSCTCARIRSHVNVQDDTYGVCCSYARIQIDVPMPERYSVAKMRVELLSACFDGAVSVVEEESEDALTFSSHTYGCMCIRTRTWVHTPVRKHVYTCKCHPASCLVRRYI